MKIQDYIRDQVFARRAQERGCLVIYDPNRRYPEIALGLANENREVIDAGESIFEHLECRYSAEFCWVAGAGDGIPLPESAGKTTQSRHGSSGSGGRKRWNLKVFGGFDLESRQNHDILYGRAIAGICRNPLAGCMISSFPY